MLSAVRARKRSKFQKEYRNRQIGILLLKKMGLSDSDIATC